MRAEAELRRRIMEHERDLHRLNAEIVRLTAAVQVGGPDWRLELERLAACREQRRVLQVQIDSLNWVIEPQRSLRAV